MITREVVTAIVNDENLITKRNAKILAKWYLLETGINKESCMCNSTQRAEIKRTVKTYINGEG